MSRLKELVSKGVRLIVTDAGVPSGDASASPGSPSREREIPAEAFEAAEPKTVERSAVPSDVEDFGAVYEEAGIALPLHGYGVDKVAEMLQSKRLATLNREVKATAVMAALEAAQVPIREVIQDGVLRDKALDAFEAAKEQEVQELRTRSEARIAAIKEEIDRFLRDKNREIEELKKASEGAGQAFERLRSRKQKEEERIHDVVAHFIEGTDNPISAGLRPKAPVAPPKGEDA